MWGRRRSDKRFAILIVLSGFSTLWVFGHWISMATVAVLALPRLMIEDTRAAPLLSNVRLGEVLTLLGGNCHHAVCFTLTLHHTGSVEEIVSRLRDQVSVSDLVMHTRFNYFIVLLKLDRPLDDPSHEQIAKRLFKALHPHLGRQVAIGYSAGSNCAPSLLLKQAVHALKLAQDPYRSQICGYHKFNTPVPCADLSKRTCLVQSNL